MPATLKLSGDRAEFPLFLEAFYKQTRIVRLVALDLEAPEFGTQRAVATLRWEFAAPARRDQTVRVASRWLPPAAARQSRSSAIAAWNEGRLTELEEATANLRRLGPELRRLAAVEAEQSALEQERRSLARWQETGEAERRAVLRKLPLLLHRLDVSAVGRAGLRPGPGGTLQIVDDD